ncbi:MAG: stage III sporulation protein AC [Oscillospiraceae bacterium]|nr:stage III sporulation protein AC [Oscillospiraceae bacterium]
MDLDLIFKIAGVGIIVAVLNMILKKSERDEYGLIVTIAGLIVVLMVIVNEIAELFDTIKSVFGF